MCHLTVTKQTQFKNCDLTDFEKQFEMVLTHYVCESPAKLVHVNFMARGEPLANPTLTETSTELLYMLGSRARELGLATKFNISTIMPQTLKKNLVECFPFITPTIYYSIYSMDDAFRKKWLPAALPVHNSLDLLADYQAVSKKIIKFHGAFIQGENDHVDQVRHMAYEIHRRGIRGEFNIVRYNPLTAEQGTETSNLEAICEVISEYMPCKVIPRVGTEVYASCGQFVEGNLL